jgi:DNA-binding transcriptional ArsR family regulator
MGEASVAELAGPFDISQPAISKHLRILERARLVSVTQDGQRRPRRIEAQPLAEASALARTVPRDLGGELPASRRAARRAAGPDCRESDHEEADDEEAEDERTPAPVRMNPFSVVTRRAGCSLPVGGGHHGFETRLVPAWTAQNGTPHDRHGAQQLLVAWQGSA